ncbi:unnamed protein product, partial [Amoebophrya sp. A120]
GGRAETTIPSSPSAKSSEDTTPLQEKQLPLQGHGQEEERLPLDEHATGEKASISNQLAPDGNDRGQQEVGRYQSAPDDVKEKQRDQTEMSPVVKEQKDVRPAAASFSSTTTREEDAILQRLDSLEQKIVGLQAEHAELKQEQKTLQEALAHMKIYIDEFLIGLMGRIRFCGAVTWILIEFALLLLLGDSRKAAMFAFQLLFTG